MISTGRTILVVLVVCLVLPPMFGLWLLTTVGVTFPLYVLHRIRAAGYVPEAIVLTIFLIELWLLWPWLGVYAALP
jgi:hypothetical protein